MRNHSLTSIVLTYPEAAAVFGAHGLAYCCHGEMTLDEACARRGLDVAAVAAEVERAIATRRLADGGDVQSLDTVALVDHLREQHELYLRAAMMFLPALAARVAQEYRARDPRLDEVRATTLALRRLLEPHLDEEEDELFRALRDGRPPSARQIEAIRGEHRELGVALDRLRALTDGYHAPSWACSCYRTLLERLQALEANLMSDVHLEDHVLLGRSMSSIMEQGQ